LNRQGIFLLALALAGVQSGPAAGTDSPPAPPAANVRLAMPYSCEIVQGAVQVKPSIEQIFDVTGLEQRLFTTCDPPFSNNCRSLKIHKFDIACGLERVSWHRVVAAIGRTAAGDATLSKGHLVLAREAGVPSGSAPSCRDRQTNQPANGECLPWSMRKPTERLVLPQSFAPLGEVGARFTEATSTVVDAAAAQLPPVTAAVSGSGPYRMTLDTSSEDPFGAMHKLGAASSLATATAVSSDADHGSEWTTSLSFATAEEAAPELVIATSSVSGQSSAGLGGSPAQMMLPWIGLLVAGLGLAAAFAYYRQPQLNLESFDLTNAAAAARRSVRKLQDQATGAVDALRDRLSETGNFEPAADDVSARDPALSSALLQLKAMLARSEAAVATLSSATVVREVMQTELAAIKSRIEDAELAARRGSTPVMKLAAQFRQIARDIDRVQSITQSASQSTSRSG
jgi:hypothetical protein